MKNLIVSISILILCFALTSCGGGGGGGDQITPPPLVGAHVEIALSNDTIGVGDRFRTTVTLSDVDDNGVIVKIRFPSALFYIIDSSVLTADGESMAIEPFVGPRTTSSETVMAYYFPRSAFGGSTEGELVFNFRGGSVLESGKIEVDEDIHNPDKTLPQQFSIRNPLFSAEDSKDITVQ